MKATKLLKTSLAILSVACCLLAQDQKAEPMTTTSQPSTTSAPAPVRILFFGDSITQMGQELEDGYVNLLGRALAGDNIEVIGAGIGSERIMNLEERFDAGVLRKNPNVVVIFIGINDIYYAQNHLDWAMGRYVEGMTRMIATMKNRNILPVIVIPSVIGEKKAGDNVLDKELDRLGTRATELGKKHNIPVINVLKAFREHLAKNNPDNAHAGILTLDGIHLNKAGNALVAAVMEPELRALLRANPNHLTISISPNEYGNLFFPDTRATITSTSIPAGGVIRYTTDGKEPTHGSAEYKSPIKLDKTTTVKTALFVQDKKTEETVSSIFTLVKQDIHPAVVDAKTLQAGGLEYGILGPANDRFNRNTVIDSGKTVTINFDKMKDTAKDAANCILFHGYLYIEKEGIYIFRLISDYGGSLTLSEPDPVGETKEKAWTLGNRDEKSPDRVDDAIGHVALKPGYYRIEVRYQPKHRVQPIFLLDWKTPGDARFKPIPAEQLFTEADKPAEK